MPQAIKVGNLELNVTHHDIAANVPIPYTFTIGAVTFAGTLYLRDPIQNSYTDGVWVGVIDGTYHLDQHNGEACADNGLLKACIKLDLSGKVLYGRLCTRTLTGHWDCGDWKKIVSW